MKSIRNGMTVAKIAVDEHGREYTDHVLERKSINAAKRDNGLNAICGKKFPPLLRDLPKIEEAEAVAA